MEVAHAPSVPTLASPQDASTISQVVPPEMGPWVKEKTRRSLAWAVLIGYLCLLAINVGGPLVLFATSSVDASDAKDLILAISGALSGLVGVLGFIVGYYFKTAGRPDPEESSETTD